MIQNWEECNQTLAELGAIGRELELLQLSYKEKLADIQRELAEICAPLTTRQTELNELITAFATEHRQDFSGMQSKKLLSGELGWRRSSKLEFCDEALTLQRIKAFQLSSYLRVKEEIDKIALKKATAAQLEQLGITQALQETFFIRPY